MTPDADVAHDAKDNKVAPAAPPPQPPSNQPPGAVQLQSEPRFFIGRLPRATLPAAQRDANLSSSPGPPHISGPHFPSSLCTMKYSNPQEKTARVSPLFTACSKSFSTRGRSRSSVGTFSRIQKAWEQPEGGVIARLGWRCGRYSGRALCDITKG